MDYLFHTFVNVAWNDTRLSLNTFNSSGNPVFLHSACLKFIWTPDIFYENVKHVENFQIISASSTVEVYPDGALRTSTRYLFKAGCQMHFENYPFDVQKCLFYIGLMQPDSVAILKWTNDEKSPYKDIIDSIEMVRYPEPLQFYLEFPTAHSVTEEFGDRSYTSLIANLTLVRRLTGSIINTYAPSTIIVVMSWVTFWIKVDVVPARVALSVTSLLTLCTQVQQYKSELPPVNYVKAMDIWLFVCIFVVFSTLVEFALCYNVFTKLCKQCSAKKEDILRRKKPSKSNVRDSKCSVRTNAWISEDKDSLQRKISNASVKSSCVACLFNQRYGQMVDDASKIIFPLSFISFSIMYWWFYLNRRP